MPYGARLSRDSDDDNDAGLNDSGFDETRSSPTSSYYSFAPNDFEFDETRGSPSSSYYSFAANDFEFDETRSSPSSSSSFAPPPRPEEITRTLKHTDMANFGKQLQRAVKTAFPSPTQSRYENVYVLIFLWANGDPKLPVNLEISKLRSVLEGTYHFKVEEPFEIPDQRSHHKVSARINDFIGINDDSSDDLKIVYYAGHSRLSKTKEVVWAR
jgi:hypothetical protein